MGGDERFFAANANSRFLPAGGLHQVAVPLTLISVPTTPHPQWRLHSDGTGSLSAVWPPATDGAHH